MSLNNVVLVGRAGIDVDIKDLRDGSKVASVTMAVDRPTKDKHTDWIDIQFWGKTAEIAHKFLKKGHMFGVMGSLRKETWQSEGQNRSRVLVVANQLRLLESKSGPARMASENDDYFGSEDEVAM